ncbi:MAG: hypothetical protein WD000_02310 [Thermodesulfobacteriota bacterium]
MFRSLLLVLLLAVSVAGLSACPNSDVGDGPAENAGEKMDDAAEDVGDMMEDVGDKAKDAVD